jgi:hypothetical protein
VIAKGGPPNHLGEKRMMGQEEETRQASEKQDPDLSSGRGPIFKSSFSMTCKKKDKINQRMHN